ncbi:Mn2+ dependent serine/threonine protein kinase [lymphocystis disease virus-China]|uniref:Phosphotransferase n=2 Tax=Lymphocystis disease virus 2 TaxID=159183 RepID=A0A6F8WZU2_9VIRU|nr:Mn2+ dependent serine/threonine protein kinase [lymphocystis disease virus-China]AAU11021.1 Mn2+ dependent serine/threonine protein kinase [lymphocystis disease virus-China]BCB67517.1 phosphotransferase [Lymphocystis disease virus 2]
MSLFKTDLIMEQLYFFPSSKEGKYAYIAECLWQGLPAIFKASKHTNYSVECDLTALVRLKLTNCIHFCKPLARATHGKLEGIVLEKIKGVLLEDMIDCKTFDVLHFISAFEQTFMAIIAMHRSYITHNDLHLRNLIVSSCETPYLIYSFGGTELFCIETFGVKTTLIDFGLSSVKYAESGLSDDGLTYLGYTLNGDLDFKNDLIQLCWNIAQRLDVYLTKERLVQKKTIIFEYIKFARYILTGLPVPVNRKAFEDCYYPCFNGLIKQTIPSKCLQYYSDDDLVEIAHMCKTLIPKPFKYKNYTPPEITELWVDLIKNIKSDQPLEKVKSVLEGEIYDPVFTEICRKIGLLAASIAAKCYEIIYERRKEYYKHLDWKDGTDLILHLPVKNFHREPQLNDLVTIQDFLKKTVTHTVFNESLLTAVYNFREVLNVIDNFKRSVNYVRCETMNQTKKIILNKNTGGLLYYKYKNI